MYNMLIFHQLFESQSSTYTYLLADPLSREAVLIDPVYEMVSRDLGLIQDLKLNLKYILDTHIHADHITGASELRKHTGAKTAVSKNAKLDCVDIELEDGSEINFGTFKIKALETPGHTDSCLSYYSEGRIFTGDALLIRGSGRTDFQGGSSEKLYQSVTKKLFQLPPETLVYPAHDYKGFTVSTIKMETEHNPRLGKNKSQAEFIQMMADLKLAYPKKIDEALPANRACGQIKNH